MEELKERIKRAQESGFTIKAIALKSNVNLNTLYAFTSGNRNISQQKIKAIENVLLEMGV